MTLCAVCAVEVRRLRVENAKLNLELFLDYLDGEGHILDFDPALIARLRRALGV